MRSRIGAYVMPGEVNWLEKALSAYYPILDDLVIAVPEGGLGWSGNPVPVEEALAIIDRIDTRGIARRISERWVDPEDPQSADNAQRRAALAALRGSVDWVMQIDNDELLPDADAVLPALDRAEELGLRVVEWPMRVLYRRTASWVWEVVAPDGGDWFEYPGPIAVRPEVGLVFARRTEEPFLRVAVRGDTRSIQVTRELEPGEHREVMIEPEQAIIHNSWARSRRAMRTKLASWGHRGDVARFYYWTHWLPTPVTWRFLTDFHPMIGPVWPRLRRRRVTPALAA